VSCHLFLPTDTLLDTAILSYATVRNVGTIINIFATASELNMEGTCILENTFFY